MLLMIAPTPKTRIMGEVEVGQQGDLLPHEIEALDRWVQAGNVVVVLSREKNDLYYALGLIADEPKGSSALTAEPLQPSVLARGVEKLQTHTEFGFKYGRQGEKTEKGAPEEEEEPPVEPPDPPSDRPLPAGPKPRSAERGRSARSRRSPPAASRSRSR